MRTVTLRSEHDGADSRSLWAHLDSAGRLRDSDIPSDLWVWSG